MRRLPLFVLPVVLLPRAILPLHVFEARYRRMIARALEADRCFGLIYHEAASVYEVQEGQIGCTAEIVEFRPLPDGRSIVLCRGAERFRVIDGIENDEEYHEALVEDYVDAEGAPGDIIARRRLVLDLFNRAVRDAAQRGDLTDVALPTEDEGDISFRVAAFLSLPPRAQQELLELPTERARLSRLTKWLQ